MKTGIHNINETRFAFLQANRSVTTNKELKSTIREFGIIQPILIAHASDLKEERMFTIGISGPVRELTDEEKNAENCYVVLDGQHRLTTLFWILQDKERKYSEKCTERVRFCIAEPEDWGESVNKYIIALNSSAKVWKSNDYIENAVTVKPTDELTKTIKGFKNLGLSISTVSRYICLNNRSLNPNSLALYTSEGKSITNADCKRGVKIYKLLKNKGMSKKLLNTRYMIDFVIEKSVGKSVNYALNFINHIDDRALEELNNLSASERDNYTIANIIEKSFKRSLDRAGSEAERNSIKDGRDYLMDISNEEIYAFINEAIKLGTAKREKSPKSKPKKLPVISKPKDVSEEVNNNNIASEETEKNEGLEETFEVKECVAATA